MRTAVLPLDKHEPWLAGPLADVQTRVPPPLRPAIITGPNSGQRLRDCFKIQHS